MDDTVTKKYPSHVPLFPRNIRGFVLVLSRIISYIAREWHLISIFTLVACFYAVPFGEVIVVEYQGIDFMLQSTR